MIAAGKSICPTLPAKGSEPYTPAKSTGLNNSRRRQGASGRTGIGVTLSIPPEIKAPVVISSSRRWLVETVYRAAPRRAV